MLFLHYCFRAGETYAQLRSECGSYIVRARSLTKLATSAPDQECDCLANPVANLIDNIILVRIHVDFSPLDYNLFMEDFDQNQLSNQLAHWWFRLGLNQRHGDFQSPALPTELQNHDLYHQPFFICIIFYIARFKWQIIILAPVLYAISSYIELSPYLFKRK